MVTLKAFKLVILTFHMRDKKNFYYLSFIMLLVLLIGVADQSINADKINPGVAPIEEKHYGLTYSDWAERWWNWAVGIPADKNPLKDPTGERCAIGQEGPVWFLGAAWSEGPKPIIRECTVPSDTALFFPIFNGETNELEEEKCKTVEQMRQCVIDSNKEWTISLMWATVNDKVLNHLKENYKVESGPFNLTIPPNNVLGDVPAGTTQAYQIGWYIMLEPLPPGKHEVHFKAKNADTVIDMLYRLTIVEKA
jgi:hypothetical protein